ncbi:RDD family protein [Bacillus salitolerans]|uniref:RDD family protein n=1 Tax=Bacillus salitolerans TaxID=1437434 RepID=A0ABW4LW41_9BACI
MEVGVHNPAGFWIRFVASILDGIIVCTPFYTIEYMVGGFEDKQILISFLYLLSLLYAIILPVIWHGYNVGKRIAGIRIAKVNGKKLGIGSMLMRTIVAYLTYLLTLGIGFIISAIMVGVRKDKRAIHDFLAGTYVTYDKP